MILQELFTYYQRKYQRKAENPGSGIAPEGFEWKEIPFLIVIDHAGRFVEVQDTREGEGRIKRGKSFLVPQDVNRTGTQILANLIWDTAEYALGANPRGREDILARHGAFRERLKNLPQDREEVRALQAFLDANPMGQIQRSPGAGAQELWKEILEGKNMYVTFHLAGRLHPTLCDSLFECLATPKSGGQPDGVCLITGERVPIARLHQPIKNSGGPQSNARLSSFDKPAFRSQGREQNRNAPVGESAAFAYTTALNHLLGKDSRQKVQIGDAAVVFWSDKPSSLEGSFASVFGFPPKDDPDSDIQAVRAVYEGVHTGGTGFSESDKFFVLGLAPNVSRLAVRFWIPDTISEISRKLRQHFDDLEIVLPSNNDLRYHEDLRHRKDPRYRKDPGHRALMWLLRDLVLDQNAEKIPPNLAGAVVRSVLMGGPYPMGLLHLAIRRIRAERQVTRMRAAVLKAILNRSRRINPTDEKEISVSLDPSNTNPGYRLGRLFAVLEKIQEDAQPKINTTIRDRYYGAASSSPASVFPQLLKLKNHHLAKLENPAFRVAHERRLQEIYDGIAYVPSHLRMEEQASFAIGYYHQRQALFMKAAKPDSTQA